MRSRASSPRYGPASHANRAPVDRGPSFDDCAASAAEPRPGILRRRIGVHAGHRDAFDFARLRTTRAHLERLFGPIASCRRLAASTSSSCSPLAAVMPRMGLLCVVSSSMSRTLQGLDFRRMPSVRRSYQTFPDLAFRAGRSPLQLKPRGSRAREIRTIVQSRIHSHRPTVGAHPYISRQ